MTADDALARFGLLPALSAADPGLVRRGRFLHADVLLAAGEACAVVSIQAGLVTAVAPGPGLMRPWRFALRGSPAAWHAYWQPVPEPGWHDLFALSKRGEMRMEGDLHPLVANLQYMKDLLALPRRAAHGAMGPTP